MFIKFDQRTNNIILIISLVLLVPFSLISVKYYQQSSFNKNKSTFIPLAKQPMDTIVADTVVPIHYWRTQNGANICFVPTERLPIVDIQVVFDAGSARDNGKSGLARLVAQSMIEGTSKKRSIQIAEQLDYIGALYFVDLDQDRATFKLRILNTNKNLQEAVNLLAEIISDPIFPKNNVDRLKNKMAVELNKELEDPIRVAELQFYKLLYNDHPYANSVLGDLNSLNSITIEDLNKFHNNYYVAKNCVVTIVGGIHRNQVKDLSNILVANLAPGNRAASLPNVQPIPGEIIKTISFMKNKQAQIIVGQPVRMADDPDYFNLIVGKIILENHIHARLVSNTLESVQGLAYTAKVDLAAFYKPGPFYLHFNTQAELTEQAIEQVKLILTEFINKGPTDEEVKLAKEHLSTSLSRKFITNTDLLDQVSYLNFYGLEFDFLDDYNHQLSFINRESVFNTWQRRINPALMAWVIVK